MAATAKHLVANDSETGRLTVDVRVSERALREVYLAPFEAAVEAGVWLVMAGYNGVNGGTMTSHPLLDEPLKGEWGFDGVVVTDWGALRSTEEPACAALDLVMPGPQSPWGTALVQAVKDGRVPEAAVDDKVRRLLRLAGRVGAFTPRRRDRVPVRRSRDTRALLRRAVAAGSSCSATEACCRSIRRSFPPSRSSARMPRHPAPRAAAARASFPPAW
ncbi:hypothetical protein SGLAM104S_10544 [Streptomyces glaucescens]